MFIFLLFFLFLWPQILLRTYGWSVAISTTLITFADIQLGRKASASFTLLRLSSPLGPDQTSLVNSRLRSNMLLSWSQHWWQVRRRRETSPRGDCICFIRKRSPDNGRKWNVCSNGYKWVKSIRFTLWFTVKSLWWSRVSMSCCL